MRVSRKSDVLSKGEGIEKEVEGSSKRTRRIINMNIEVASDENF